MNWNEKEIVNWIGTDARPLKRSSRNVYKFALKCYSEFTEMSASQMIAEARRDFRKAQTDPSKGLNAKRRIIYFEDYLLHDYDGGRLEGKGLSTHTTRTYVMAIRSFYKYNGLPIKFHKREIKKAYTVTLRKMITLPDLKRLLEACDDFQTRTRDKSLIMAIYQSGMDISTTLKLNMFDWDKARKFENGRVRMLYLVRKKTNWRFRTFVGRDGVNFIESYLEERRMDGGIKLSDPLFTQRVYMSEMKRSVWTNRRLDYQTIRVRMNRLALKAMLVSREELDMSTINPCGLHALRESFSKVGTAFGTNSNALDYFQGHETEYSGAYSNLPDVELYRVYKKLEPNLSVSRVLVKPEDKLRELAQRSGIDFDALIKRKALEWAESGAGSGGGFFPDFEDPDFLEGLLKDEIKRRLAPKTETNGGSPVQKVVMEDEVEGYLNRGWRYVGSLNGDKIIVERT